MVKAGFGNRGSGWGQNHEPPGPCRNGAGRGHLKIRRVGAGREHLKIRRCGSTRFLQGGASQGSQFSNRRRGQTGPRIPNTGSNMVLHMLNIDCWGYLALVHVIRSTKIPNEKVPASTTAMSSAPSRMGFSLFRFRSSLRLDFSLFLLSSRTLTHTSIQTIRQTTQYWRSTLSSLFRSKGLFHLLCSEEK